MQVSSTLIAAQQAAREAQARFQAQHAPQNLPQGQGTQFARALEQTTGFSPLPLRQTAAMPPSQPAAQQAGPTRMGSRLDITV